MPSTNGRGAKPERVALYLRVSSEEQRERESIENQREFLKNYQSLYGLEVVGVYEDDGVSGTIPLHERPGGKELVEAAEAERFETLLVYRLDRLGRSLLVIVDAHDRLQQAGIALRSATEPIDTSNPSGRLIFQMLASFAEYERETIGERTRAGLHRALRNGKHTGRIPYGYDIASDGSFVVVEDEAQIVRQIISNIANRATLYSESKRLNDEGIPSPGYRFRGDERRRGTRQWSLSTVRDVVYQTAYSGVHRVRVASESDAEGRVEFIERPVPAIVEPGLRERAEAQLVKNKSRTGELRKNGRKYLLTGLVRCGICGLACTGRTSTARVSGGSKKYFYYGCESNRTNRGGGVPRHRVSNIPAEWLEELVWTDVRAFLANPGEFLERVREHMANEDDSDDLEDRRSSLKKRLVEAEGELDRLVNLYATGEIDASWLTTHVRDREAKIENLKMLLASVESDIASRIQDRLAAEQAQTWLRALADNLSEVEGDTPEAFQKRRELVELLVERITTDRDEDGRPRVNVTYRFGPPPEEVFVSSVGNSTVFLTHHVL